MDYVTYLDDNITYAILTTEYGRRFSTKEGRTLIEEFKGTTHKFVIYYEACRDILITSTIIKRHFEDYFDLIMDTVSVMKPYCVRTMDIRLDWQKHVKESNK